MSSVHYPHGRTAAGRLLVSGRNVVATLLLAAAATLNAQTPPPYTDCAAYFFMAANVKGIGEFDRYYRSGEFAYNHAVKVGGEAKALEQFNLASQALSELIERNWNLFDRADKRYGVICADLYREANRPEIP